MATQGTVASAQFDLGTNVLGPLATAGGDVAKILAGGYVAKQTAKELRKSGATGGSVALVIGIAVAGVLGLAAIVVLARK